MSNFVPIARWGSWGDVRINKNNKVTPALHEEAESGNHTGRDDRADRDRQVRRAKQIETGSHQSGRQVQLGNSGESSNRRKSKKKREGQSKGANESDRGDEPKRKKKRKEDTEDGLLGREKSVEDDVQDGANGDIFVPDDPDDFQAGGDDRGVDMVERPSTPTTPVADEGTPAKQGTPKIARPAEASAEEEEENGEEQTKLTMVEVGIQTDTPVEEHQDRGSREDDGKEEPIIDRKWELVTATEDGVPLLTIQKHNVESLIEIAERLRKESVGNGCGVLRVRFLEPKMRPENLRAKMIATLRESLEQKLEIPVKEQKYKRHSDGVYTLSSTNSKKEKPLDPGFGFVDISPEKGAIDYEWTKPEDFWSITEGLGARKYSSKTYYATDLNAGFIWEDKLTVLDTLQGDMKNFVRFLHPSCNGVHSSFLYGGWPNSVFALHTEDFLLYSANFVQLGAPKVWYIVRPSDRLKTEELLALKLKKPRGCEQFLRHNPVLVSPEWLKSQDIGVTEVIQKEGDLLIIYPEAIHYGYNSGYNIAEAINFASFQQQQQIKTYQPCTNACSPSEKPVTLSEM